MNDPKSAALYGKQFQRGQMTKPYIFGKEILPLLTKHFAIKSIIDIGSGNCGFLKAAMEIGITDVIGVDGAWIDNLMIPKKYFKSFNLRLPFKLDREFDLVVSLETAEHINEIFAETFIETLTGLGDTILFSAARVGQSGVNHVNCQPFEYWEKKFNILNFTRLTSLNIQAILNKAPVKDLWQTKNSIVYIRKNND